MPCLCWLKKSLNISLVDGFSIFQLTQFTFQDSRHSVQQGGFRSPFLLLVFIDIGFDSLSCVFCHLLREQKVKPCWWPLVNISLEKKDFTIVHWTLPELWVSTSARVLSIGAGSAGGSRTRSRSCQSSIWTDIRLQTTYNWPPDRIGGVLTSECAPVSVSWGTTREGVFAVIWSRLEHLPSFQSARLLKVRAINKLTGWWVAINWSGTQLLFERRWHNGWFSWLSKSC